jgi:hypothetical protein
MAKKLFSILVAAGLVAGALIAPPANAQTEVPAEPNIVDPAGDANYINEGTAPGAGHNHTGPTDAGTYPDLLAVWFTHDAENISVHFQTEGKPPGPVFGLTYQAFTTPGEGSVGSNEAGCLRFLGNIPASNAGGGTYQDDPFIRLVDRCNVGTSIFPRSYSPLLEDGEALTSPSARSSQPTIGEHTNIGFATPSTDTTEVGTDYVLSAGEKVKAKSKKEKKAKKNATKKGKGKGKGKGKKAAACAPFKPGEAGTDQPLVKVTDAATEEKPVEQSVTLDGSAADFIPVTDPSEAYFNIQVDSAAADAGLYVFLEFPSRRDYDLNLLHTDGSYAARARSFNTVVGTPGEQFSNPGHGGEGTDHSETLVGIKTSDCGGWTLQVQNWFGEGGDFAVKVWLGEVQNEPQAPGEETP